MDVKETGILGSGIEEHWYYSSKAKAMEYMLEGIAPARILDVGAGSGFFSRHLLAHSDAVEAWCVDIGYAADSDVKGAKAIHYRRSVDAVNADLLLFMDVLEHVEDDIALLQEYMAKVPQGSHLLITVPAFQFLWSGHDLFLEHKRRYTLKQLEAVVCKSGLRVRRGAYGFATVFPIAAAMRIVDKVRNSGNQAKSQLRRHNPVINSILKSLCSLELPLLQFNRMAGLTVFCLAEKV